MENTDLKYLRGILANDTPLLEEIYRKFLPAVFGMLRRNNGSFEDAKDVFQEALVVVFRNAARPGFQLTAPFQSYLLGISRFIWLRQLKKNARTEVAFAFDERYSINAEIEQQILEAEKAKLYREKFALLGSDCRQLLQRFFDREPLNSIAADMGYTPDYVKKKNKTCKEKLLGLIQNDPIYLEITSSTTATV